MILKSPGNLSNTFRMKPAAIISSVQLTLSNAKAENVWQLRLDAMESLIALMDQMRLSVFCNRHQVPITTTIITTTSTAIIVKKIRNQDWAMRFLWTAPRPMIGVASPVRQAQTDKAVQLAQTAVFSLKSSQEHADTRPL